MLETALPVVLLQDLPVCFPGRQCVDFVPAEADLVSTASSLTSSSAAIAAGCFALLGAALVLVGMGLWRQWRGLGVRPWLVATVIVLLFAGFTTTTIVDNWFSAIESVYSAVYGQPAAPAPASLNGSWGSVLVAGRGMELLALVAIAVLVTVGELRRRRRARLGASSNRVGGGV